MIRTHKVPFVLYCDFESYLQPAPDGEDSQHVPSGFCCLRVSRYPEYETSPVVYSGGSDVMSRFYEHLRSEKREICKILGFQAPMKRISIQQQSTYDSSMVCPSCSATYSTRNRKVRHHDHVTGDFVRPLCNNCNLQLKPRQALISKNHLAECVEPSYTFDSTWVDKTSSSLITRHSDVSYARTSYVDSSQRLPIAVGQPGLSAFSRVDMIQSRPATIDPTACTSTSSAFADYLRLTTSIPSRIAVSAASSAAPLQSPSIH